MRISVIVAGFVLLAAACGSSGHGGSSGSGGSNGGDSSLYGGEGTVRWPVRGRDLRPGELRRLRHPLFDRTELSGRDLPVPVRDAVQRQLRFVRRDPLRDCTTTCAAGQVCSNNACTSSCSTGQTLCGTACVVTNGNDALNCGGCGKTCAAGRPQAAAAARAARVSGCVDNLQQRRAAAPAGRAGRPSTARQRLRRQLDHRHRRTTGTGSGRGTTGTRATVPPARPAAAARPGRAGPTRRRTRAQSSSGHLGVQRLLEDQRTLTTVTSGNATVTVNDGSPRRPGKASAAPSTRRAGAICRCSAQSDRDKAIASPLRQRCGALQHWPHPHGRQRLRHQPLHR